MDRRDVIKRMLYPKCKTATEFKFDTLMVNPLLSYITVQDIANLNKIATSIKYSSKPKEKYKMIDQILVPRGFKKMASGTNRVVYRFLDDYRFVLKVAIDKVGLSDNGNEFKNQQLLKPFVAKCFEVSPCGTVGIFERVVPITSREEFINISEDIFDLINNIIGKYVLDDIGEKFYMNYGLREGFGPVLLDYPYVFELDGRKLICSVEDPMEPKGYCGGMIDYDLGYNNLICTKCGKRYLATELKSNKKSDGGPKIIIEGDDNIMKCVLKRGDQVISTLNNEEPVATNVIPSKPQYDRMQAQLKRNTNYGNNKEGQYRPALNNHDDVTFQARLRGQRKSKDIDKIARDQEYRKKENTKTVPVSFNNNSSYKEKEDTRSSFEPRLNKRNNQEQQNVVSKPSENVDPSFIQVTIENGYIYDKNHKLLGYTLENGYVKKLQNRSKELEEYEKEKSNREVKEEIIDTDNEELAIPDEDVCEYKSEPCTTPMSEKLKEVYASTSYKTAGVTSPIEQHFHNSELIKKESEEDKIPKLTIRNGEKTYSNDSISSSKSSVEDY